MDHCKHCANRGNLINCATSECSIQESWYPNALIGQIGDLQKELAELKRIVESAPVVSFHYFEGEIMPLMTSEDWIKSGMDKDHFKPGETRHFRLVPVEG